MAILTNNVKEWTDWREWIGAYAGREVAPRVPGKGKQKVIEAAPGSYARLRADP